MKRFQNNKFTMIWRLLPSQFRVRSALVLCLTILGAGLEMVGLGMVMPTMSILMNPNSMTDLGLPAFLRDGLEPFAEDQLVVVMMLALLIAYAVKGLYLGLLNWIQATFAYSIKATLSDGLLSTYIHADHEFHLSENSARLIRNITIEVEQFISHVLVPTIRLISELFIVIAILSLLIYVNPVGTAFLVLIIGASMAAFQQLTQKRLLEWGRRRQRAEGLRIQRAQEVLGGIKDVKLLHKERWFQKEYSAWNWSSSMMARNQLALSQLPYIWLEIVAIGALTFIVLFAMHSSMDSARIIPMLGLFGAAAFRVIPSANRILMALQAVKYASPVIELMNGELNRGAPEPEETNSILTFRNTIRLDQLSYSYPGQQQPVINNITIDIDRGDAIGIVGTSGAGKSTLINLFLGLLKPTSGSITVDGANMFSNIRGWQQNLGYVPQHIFLTDDTLRRNIALGVPDSDINEDDIHQALRHAQLLEFVNSLPNGLDTLVGERGVRLSGGQLQRVGIARALYRKPTILVLDEASSALDVKTETALMASVKVLSEFMTLIIVTHRLSTVQDCDRVYTIEQGQVSNVLHPQA